MIETEEVIRRAAKKSGYPRLVTEPIVRHLYNFIREKTDIHTDETPNKGFTLMYAGLLKINPTRKKIQEDKLKENKYEVQEN